ncbi:MAG: HD domain-containing protein [Fibrobacteraceae bacterium]|nr:HD domain-containing protein [Fibrobacteraceae bacterium]
MFTYNDALAIATKAHQGQTDKIGSPYIEHLKAVAQALKERGADEKTQIVAMLEDTMGESTAYTKEKLSELGVPNEILDILALLTHHKDQAFIDDCSCKLMAEAVPAEEATYEAREKEFLHYISRVKQNPIAKAVKIEALKRQLDENFIPKNERRELKTKFRIRKYQKAIESLEK